MENVILTVHLILAVLLIGVVLLQRSEGGGLGMGSSPSVMTGRQAANALSKTTWLLAIAFLATSLALTLLAARQSSVTSVVDQLGLSVDSAPVTGGDTGGMPALPTYTPPPGAPVVPGAGQTEAPAPAAADAPAAPEPAADAPAETAPAPAGN